MKSIDEKFSGQETTKPQYVFEVVTGSARRFLILYYEVNSPRVHITINGIWYTVYENRRISDKTWDKTENHQSSRIHLINCRGSE